MSTDVKRLVLIIFGAFALGGAAFGLLVETALIAAVSVILALVLVAVLWMLFKDQPSTTTSLDSVENELKLMLEESEKAALRQKIKEYLNEGE